MIAFALAAALSLDLRCQGNAQRPDGQATQVTTSDGQGHYAYGTAVSPTVRTFAETLGFYLADGAATVTMPASMRPFAHGGDADLPVADLQVRDLEITGRIRLNLMNKPVVKIDRSSGAIHLTGFNGWRFDGVCASAGVSQRRF